MDRSDDSALREPGARYATLDGMRGVAALLVALFHFQQRLGAPSIDGYLAVDLFFVLSGLVLTQIYEPRFARGLGPLRFTMQRFFRFYPLYALGFAAGALCLSVSPPPELTGLGMLAKAAALLFGGVMLPTPFSASLYPLNGAAWSLFFELAVNLLFAALLWRLPRTALLVVAAPALLYLCVVVRAPLYLNIGWRWEDLSAGCARTLFSFTAGILIGRTLAGVERRGSNLALILPLLASLPIVIPSTHPKGWTLLAVAAFFPLVVALSATVEPPQFARRAMLGLGSISFPLYAIHWPLAALLAPLLRSMPVAQAVALFFGICLCLAFLAQRLVDDPVQRWLKNNARGQWPRAAPAITTTSPAAR